MELLDNLYLTNLILIQLPPISIFSSIITTHVLVRIIFVCLLIAYSFTLTDLKGKLLKKHIVVLALIFFISQSVSILAAQNIPIFLFRYKDVLFSFTSLCVTYYFLRNYTNLKKIILIIFVGLFLNFTTQSLILFYPSLFSTLGKVFVGASAFSAINYDIQNGRINYEAYDEILIPLLLVFFIRTRRKFAFLVILIITFFTLYAGFRSRLLALGFSLFTSFIFFFKYIKKYIFLFIIFSLISLYIFLNLQPFFYSSLTLERTLFPTNQDYATISSRLSKWRDAFNVGISHPITGAGLGNFYDYISNNEKQFRSLDRARNESAMIASEDPHNIFFLVFVESGFFGLTSFIILILYFMYKDICCILGKGKDLIKISFILGFWSLFLFSLVTPTSTIKYYLYFWLFRIIIETPYVKNL